MKRSLQYWQSSSLHIGWLCMRWCIKGKIDSPQKDYASHDIGSTVSDCGMATGCCITRCLL